MIGRVELGSEEIPHLAIGLVLALALLVLHHAPLFVELGLADGSGQMAHPIRLHPEREIEGIGGNILEIVGPVLVGGAVHVGGAGLLERTKEVLVVVLGAIVHQVLEQMREAGSAGPLVLGAHVVPDVHRHDGRLAVFMHDDGQAVGQHEPLVGDMDSSRCRVLRRKECHGCRRNRRPNEKSRSGE
jgi:hypothetical protein